MKQIYLVCFDIEDDKIRRKIGDKLLAYGHRVQYSVFEIAITQDSQLKQLKAQLNALLEQADTISNDLRFYNLNTTTLARSFTLNEQPIGVFPSATIL